MRRALIVVPLSLAVAIGPVLLPADAGRTRRPAVVLEGRGWGHGHGLGQYGAAAMARSGASWQKIVRHYYAGIRTSRTKMQNIRVLVANGRSIGVASERSPEARWRGGSIALAARRLHRVRLDGARLVLERARRGTWARVGTMRAPVTIRPRGARLTLASPDAARSYDGYFTIVRRDGALNAIATMPLERYVAGVVPREMPSSWPAQALRAQAVAARTYAVRVAQVARQRRASYDICATTRCQVFGGVAFRYGDGPWHGLQPRTTTAAVAATRSVVLTYRGAPILAQYSSSTGGRTAPGSAPYLRGAADPGDARSPYHRWVSEVTPATIERAWPSIGRFTRVRVTARDGRGEWGGRVKRVRVEGTRGAARISGDAFRMALGLRSTWFRVAPASLTIRFGRDLRYGTSHGDVGFLQRRLRAHGYYPATGPITTYFGDMTRGAVLRFQRARRLRATGFLDRSTRVALNGGTPARVERRRSAGRSSATFTRDLSYGMSGRDVRRLQLVLRSAGHFPRSVKATGYFGGITREAVRRYQRAHRIPATGYVGPRTRRALARG